MDPLKAYGCLAVMHSFGEHITCIVLVPHLEVVVQGFRRSLADSSGMREVVDGNLAKVRQISMEMLKSLEK